MKGDGANVSKNLNQHNYLPDFCSVRIVFSVMIIAELLAFVLSLAVPTAMGGGWAYLSLLSLYILWVALCCTIVLCSLRKFMVRLSHAAVTVLCYLLVVGIALLLAELVFRWASEWMTFHASHVEFLMSNLGVSSIAVLLALRYFYLQHQLKCNMAAENQARIQALHARIRPHFLFNSLNAIASLIRHQPQRAEEAVEDLADLFRHNLNDERALVSLAHELDTAKRYLNMEQLRLGERLRVEWALGDLPNDAAIPSLALQPLLENAIYHGIERLAEGGVISCAGRRHLTGIEIMISNPVAGQAADGDGHRLALDNLRQRLQAHFGALARLEVSTGNGLYQVKLLLPYQVYSGR